VDVIPLLSNRPADRFYRRGRKITKIRESRPPVTASQRIERHLRRHLLVRSSSASPLSLTVDS